jgi:hypothetical protein
LSEAIKTALGFGVLGEPGRFCVVKKYNHTEKTGAKNFQS